MVEEEGGQDERHEECFGSEFFPRAHTRNARGLGQRYQKARAVPRAMRK